MTISYDKRRKRLKSNPCLKSLGKPLPAFEVDRGMLPSFEDLDPSVRRGGTYWSFQKQGVYTNESGEADENHSN